MLTNLFVADTHTVLWYLTADPHLSATAQRLLQEAESGFTEILIPTIVLAELLHIAEKKRFANIDSIVKKLQIEFRFTVVPFDILIFEKMCQLPKTLEIHDRVIAATAHVYRGEVITKDPEIKKITATRW